MSNIDVRSLRLSTDSLYQHIVRRGLGACGELISSATPAQLTTLLDIDLWHHERPGRDERFDADRFGEWLEVLVDTGDAIAARTIGALDTGVVVAGLSHFIRVFDPGTFEPTDASDDEPVDRHARMNSEPGCDRFECEVGGYLVRARTADAWDAIVAVLMTLATEHHDRFHAVMQGCRRLSNSRPEIDGLDELLPVREQHLHDVKMSREARRSQQGYATPADARAFLQTARHARHAPAAEATTGMNPIALAYLRAASADGDEPSPPNLEHAQPTGSASRGDAGSRPGSPEARRLLPGALEPEPPVARLSLVGRLLDAALRHDESAYRARGRELAFLANVLIAGSAVQSRAFTPQEASEAAACVCNLGLECWPEGISGDGFLVDHDLVAAFEVGWSVLYQEVSLFVVDQLLIALAGLRGGDAETQHELRSLCRALQRAQAAGTPWSARDEAESLTALDPAICVAVLGLLDDCPTVAAALAAVTERRTTPVSPTAFEFIATRTQVRDVQRFAAALPEVLAR